MKCVCSVIAYLMIAVLCAQDYHFAHYPFDPELGDLRGIVLYQDRDYNMRIGTTRGLLSFDGLEFHTEQLGAGLSDTEAISAVYMDDHGITWLGTEEGTILRGHPGRFSIFRESMGAPVRAITKQDQVILIATYGRGLIALRDHDTSRVEIPLPSPDVYALYTDRAGTLWLGTDAGITAFESLNRLDTSAALQLRLREGLPDEIIMSLAGSPDGGIWAGAFEKGFCRIAPDGSISCPVRDWDHGAILSMVSIDDQELWISTERGGLMRYGLRSGRQTPVSIPGNPNPVIVGMHADDEGNLWLLDAYRGLYRTNRRFEGYTSEIESVQALLFDHAGQLYAGHATGLYLLWPFNQVPPQRILPDVNVLSLYEDKYRNLWVGTFGQGLYCRPYGRNTWWHYGKDNGLTDESILSITGWEDMLWLATLGGVTRITLDQGKPQQYQLRTTNYNLADGLGTNFIYTAHADSRGRIWFGTDGKGISVLDGEQIRNFQMANTVLLHTVYSMTEDLHGRMCFVTDRDGVFCFDGETFTQIDLPATLRDKEINNIVADRLGNLLLAHDAGVDILTPGMHMIRYLESTPDLLLPNLNAHFTDSTGSIWIAGQKKILRYNPLPSAQRHYPFNTLTELRVYLQPVDFRTQNTFAAAENYLTFSYMGQWYTNPRDVLYRYRIEGLDPDWKETRERSVTYQNIPPGSYRFVLESTSSGYFTAPNTIAYAFTVSKPFYQTLWFLFLLTLTVVLAGYAALRLREKRIERAAALKRRQVESQLQTLKAQINPHFLFNSFNTLISVIEEDPATAVEYVENFSDFYRSILQYREKNLIPIKEEIDIVRSYTYILRKRYGAGFDIRIADQWPAVWIVPLALQICVENAVKHNVISERRPLVIDIRMQDQMIIVENTLRKKQRSEESTGFGLQSIMSRYALLGGHTVSAEEAKDAFIVTIPALHRDEIPDY